MPPSWRGRSTMATATRPRDLLRQGPVLRALGPLAVHAPHLSDARRRLARAARHGRHRRALQVRPEPRMDPRDRLRLRAGEARQVPRFHPQLLSGPRREPPACRLHRHPPQALPRGRAGARLRHPRAGASTGSTASSPSTASRARASRRRWRSGRRWRGCSRPAPDARLRWSALCHSTPPDEAGKKRSRSLVCVLFRGT